MSDVPGENVQPLLRPDRRGPGQLRLPAGPAVTVRHDCPAIGLAGAGASFADVLRLTFCVTRWSPEKTGDFMAGVESVADEIGLALLIPPASLIGVDYLFEPHVLVEVEATALLD